MKGRDFQLGFDKENVPSVHGLYLNSALYLIAFSKLSDG